MKKLLAFLLLGLAIIAIPAYFYLHRPVKSDKQPLILGHGGMGVRSMHPLNSAGSINKAFTYPVDGTEIDVKVSLDGELIAFHDGTLEESTSCKRNVASTLSKDLENCEYNSMIHSENVQRLNSILDSSYPDGTIFSLDLKPDGQVEGDFLVGFGMELVKLTQDYPQYQFLIESQSREFLSSLKMAGAKAKLFYYGNRENIASQIVAHHEFDGISINIENITKQEVQSIQNRGFEVMLWGCGSVFSNRKALEMEPDIIQTDAIPSMIKILEKE